MPRGEQIAKPAERATRLAGFFFQGSFMTFAPKRLACGAAVILIVAACDAPTPVGPVPQARLDGGTTIAGQLIAFASPRDAGLFQTFVMNADGSNPVRLTYDNASDLYPGWSPDGSKITFESDRDGNFEIYVMNADGSSPMNLTHNPAHDEHARWSPRGNKIAFSSDRDGNSEIYVMRSDGSRQTRLTDDPGVDYGPAWSPDAESIAFATNRDGNFEIYVMQSDGTQQTRVTNDPGYDADPTWARTQFQTVPPPDLTRCVPSGTQDDINARLRQPGDVAVLCAGAIFELTSPVAFIADGQQVHTEGFPTDDRRARLRLASPSAVMAVYMRNRSNVVLSNVIVAWNA